LGIVIPKRERYLEAQEFKLVWDAISSAPKMSLPVKNGLKILLLTGTRTGELIKAEWKHIDRDNFNVLWWP
jgi:integrase